MQTLLITGSNRGIGLGLVKTFLQQSTPWTIIATCRDINKAQELSELSSKHSHLKILTFDITNFLQYDSLINQVNEITLGKGLNLLINNAGISTKFTRIENVKLEQLVDNFTVNTFGPIMLTKACLSLLKAASKANETSPIGINRAAVINISSILGSIGDNTDGGFYPYRCSKTALNAATKSLSIDLKRDSILVTSIHPGWVKTDMGGKSAPLEVSQVAPILVDTLKSLTESHSGAFIQYDGKHLKW